MTEMNTPWSRQLIQDQNILRWSCGPVRLFIQRTQGDWLWAFSREKEEVEPCFEVLKQAPKSLSWTRWAFSDEVEAFRIAPAMLDKALVVRPRFPLMLPPGTQVHFYVSVPLVFKIIIDNKGKDCPIAEVPSLALNTLWYGDFLEGELCYALHTRAVRNTAHIKHSPHQAICPVLLKNDSKEAVPFEKICLRAKYLSIYQGPNYLWTSAVQMNSHKKIIGDHASYETIPPGILGTAPLLAGPQESIPSGILQTGGHMQFAERMVKSFFD